MGLQFGVDPDNYSFSGLKTLTEIEAEKKRKKETREANNRDLLADQLTTLKKILGNLEGLESRVSRLEQLSRAQYLLGEKMVLLLDQLLPEERRQFSIPDAERRARAVLGFSVFEVITPHMLKSRRKRLVKAHHPDTNGGQPSDEFLKIEEAYQVLLEAIGE